MNPIIKDLNSPNHLRPVRSKKVIYIDNSVPWLPMTWADTKKPRNESYFKINLLTVRGKR